MAMIKKQHSQPVTGKRSGFILRIIAFCLLPNIIMAGDKGAHLELNMISFDLPPYVIGESSQPKGLAVVYVKELMKRAGVPYKLSLLPPKRALIYTLATPSTCVFPIERSQEREVQFSWISPITISRHGLFSHPKRPVLPVRVLNDIKDLRVGSYLGSAIGEYLTSLEFNVDLAAKSNANISKLKLNRIDLWASETLSANYYAQQQGFELKEPEIIFFTTLGAIGCHRNVAQVVISRLNETLREMYKDGTISKLQSAFNFNSIQ